MGLHPLWKLYIFCGLGYSVNYFINAVNQRAKKNKVTGSDVLILLFLSTIVVPTWLGAFIHDRFSIVIIK
jgi:hypothetical protein